MKEFSTGEIASRKLRKAKDKPFTWTYFDKPRIVSYETLQDGTVVEIQVALKDWDADTLRVELERKYNTNDGSPRFSFNCVTTSGTVEIMSVKFRVNDKDCYAFDDRQTLVISKRSTRDREPMLEQAPTLKLVVERSHVTLYDENLRRVKGEEDRIRLSNQEYEDSMKAAKDRMKAAKDM